MKKVIYIVFILFFIKQLSAQNRSLQEVEKSITGCPAFTIDAPRKGGKVVDAATFGLKEHGTPENNVAAIKKALAFCKKTNAYKLTIPKGIYYLRSINTKPDKDSLAYALANVRVPHVTRQIAIEGMKDFIFDGQGAEFIIMDSTIVSMGALLFVANCERVRVENLTLDWDWATTPVSALGFIESVNVDGKYIDLYVPNLRLLKKTKLNKESGTTSKDWNPFTNMRNPETKPFVLTENSPGYGELGAGKILKDTVIDEHHIRVYMMNQKSIQTAKIGQCSNLTFHTNYDPYGVEANGNDHLVFHNINVYTALNHRGFACDYNKYLEISSVNIIPRPGTGRTKSSHGTFEIHNSRGYFLFENNVVDSEMDDYMHLSDGFVAGGIKVKSKNSILCERIQYYSARYTLFAGAKIDFLNEKFAKTGQQATIASVEWLPEFYPAKDKQIAAIVTFKEDLPANLPEKTGLWNRELGSGNYILRNNEATTLACRGILTSWPNGIIENNSFSNAGYAGLYLSSNDEFGDRWFHGPGPSNIIVRNNRFDRTNQVLRNKADIDITLRKTPGQFYKNILIEDNIISKSVSEANISLCNIDGLIVRRNKMVDIKNPNSYSENFGVKVQECSNVFISK
jgi:hypothetical protein